MRIRSNSFFGNGQAAEWAEASALGKVRQTTGGDMGNKTIYVKDDELWNRAKALAGKDGLSGVIGQAIADYVVRREAAEAGFSRIRFEFEFPDDPERLEVVEFDGTRVGRLAVDSGNGAVEVYVTRAGTLVCVYEYEHEVGGYETYQSIAKLAEDEYLNRADEADVSGLLQALRRSSANRTWID